MEFRTTTADDIPMIRQFLLDEIYPDKPMSRALDLLSETYEMQFHLSLVPTGLSFVGFLNGELIGVALCGVKTLGEAERYKKEAERLKGTRWAKVLELGYKIEKESNILQRFSVDRSFHCYIYMESRRVTEACSYNSRVYRPCKWTRIQIGNLRYNAHKVGETG